MFDVSVVVLMNFRVGFVVGFNDEFGIVFGYFVVKCKWFIVKVVI